MAWRSAGPYRHSFKYYQSFGDEFVKDLQIWGGR